MPTVNETLLALNIDELSPLEALTKLHELKRLAAGERTATEREIERLNTRVNDAREILVRMALAGECSEWIPDYVGFVFESVVYEDHSLDPLTIGDLRAAGELLDCWYAEDFPALAG